MGEVYRALDTRLGRTVAIKTLNSAQSQRFQQEARAIAALNHPHICVLHDIGPDAEALQCAEKAMAGAPWCPYCMGLMAAALANEGHPDRAETLLVRLRDGSYRGPVGLTVSREARSNGPSSGQARRPNSASRPSSRA
jgi:serine/threonine protein kinase